MFAVIVTRICHALKTNKPTIHETVGYFTTLAEAQAYSAQLEREFSGDNSVEWAIAVELEKHSSIDPALVFPQLG